jgi:hypothetical protein
MTGEGKERMDNLRYPIGQLTALREVTQEQEFIRMAIEIVPLDDSKWLTPKAGFSQPLGSASF